MEKLDIGQNDWGDNWNFVCKEKDSSGDLVVIDVTDYTVTIKIWEQDDPDNPIASLACVKDVPASGQCHWVITNVFTTGKTVYLGELELTKASYVRSSYAFIINVMESA